jgi:hypothetical protein
MRRLKKYQLPLGSHFHSAKKTSLLWLLGSILHFQLTAQDSTTLRSFPNNHLLNSAMPIANRSQSDAMDALPATTYQVNNKSRLPIDTAAINNRYIPSNNPLLLWKNDYPLTPEQIKRRQEQKKREESISGILLKGFFQKKKNSPIIPTL